MKELTPKETSKLIEEITGEHKDFSHASFWFGFAIGGAAVAAVILIFFVIFVKHCLC